MKKVLANILWLLIALAGAGAYATLALYRGEALNSVYLLIAALCTYTIGYRFYSKWIAARVLMLNDRRATPCEVHDDGKDFVKTNKWIVFGHHFAAISGPGPLVGPVLAAQFGYLPGTLWILIGVVLGGAVQDFVILFCSIRRDGKSLAQMIKDELGTPAGAVAVVAVVAILIILLAVLALVVVNALGESPWGIFTVGATIPIAMFMGGYLRFWRVGRVREVTVIGVVMLLLAVWGGQYVYHHPALSRFFTLGKEPIAWAIIGYGLAASILPVWLLLAPRDYLSTFMKLGTIFALAFGIFLVLPELRMPPLTRFLDGSGLVIPGTVFPFCFITIACGAISGFHTLVASGITPKIITRESYARPVGYGAMCLESLVAIMAMIAACTLEPGVYLSMNVDVGNMPVVAKVAATAAKVTGAGFPVTADQMTKLAAEVGEPSLVGKTGGAVTLAVGMANIFSRVTQGRWLDLWYHFAIMFEALFILTTIDAGTRVGRYLLQDALGHIWKPLRQTGHLGANLLASGGMVVGWGFFLIMGVRDPEGGVKALWPIFGISNQMLSGIALCLATTIILKTTLQDRANQTQAPRSPALALITLLPLVWLLGVTFTAGAQKIAHSQPGIGFLAANRVLREQEPKLQAALAAAEAGSDAPALARAKADLRLNRVKRFNNSVDAVATGFFMVLVTAIVVLSVREWVLLLRRRRPAVLRETEPVWLPDYAIKESKPFRVAGVAALAFALAKELSGEAEMDRAAQDARRCECRHDGADKDLADLRGIRPHKTDVQIYLQVAEKRFKGVKRCC
ncbi:MAG TPA: carbon starvation CstA family protein [Candidatus Paceibacterota bacterium]|nr:carbon starvation CstA family protein [Verrucomicrobiota bacterium]HSA12668.1 carbon starvation CstA family protein [Candidatus Paceibacterota bacterium]